MPQLQPGQPVPDFNLTAGSGESVTLSQFRGKYVVLYFYPKDMTPTCTEESCQFRDYNGQFESLNTEVIGISPDDLKSHEKFAAKYELPFPLLSDPDHEVCELFGVWQLKKMYGREYMGVVRSTFVIDPQGKLVREWRGVRIKGHVEQVLEAVKETQAGVETP
ncbi:thioredoxin-dependent thiol peroxidase [Paenibacillus tyrfis]|uniref:thioredoxin-dependent peroxiredoxin n=1 Tax=Paenibacillus tyrfis TaxID=1501230 RepID=A0A081PBA0_9BACL|nr:thioredoxin-dependent thiol peroxidase [Paenibacillus tyrfis]KEQ27973.1 peroxiredoxin [Paenibacillus tyrfis]